jgi:hypothetical protein
MPFVDLNFLEPFGEILHQKKNIGFKCSRTTGDRTKAARLCSLGEKPGTEIKINLAASIDEWRRI